MASRLGHRTLHSCSKSFSGDIDVILYRMDLDGADEDCVRITLSDHDTHQRIHTLFDGPIKDLADLKWRNAQIVALAGPMLGGQDER
jgi:hypothetical protein